MPGYVDNSGNLSGTGTPFVESEIDPGNYATYNSDGWPPGIGPPYYRTEVGEWENSASPYGTFDQGGNVWEWDESLAGPDGERRGVRGSQFRETYDHHLHAEDRGNFLPTEERPGIGFRVACIPEPGSITLLVCGAMFGLIWRRRRR